MRRVARIGLKQGGSPAARHDKPGKQKTQQVKNLSYIVGGTQSVDGISYNIAPGSIGKAPRTADAQMLACICIECANDSTQPQFTLYNQLPTRITIELCADGVAQSRVIHVSQRADVQGSMGPTALRYPPDYIADTAATLYQDDVTGFYLVAQALKVTQGDTARRTLMCQPVDDHSAKTCEHVSSALSGNPSLQEDSMADPLGSIEKQLGDKEHGSEPPLDQWDPPLSGDIDIVIRADGGWLHEGATFKRTAIVDLFTSILRREADGHYYLVTPVEKWRIRVEAHALQVVDITRTEADGTLVATCNHGPDIVIGEQHPLCASTYGDVPWLACNNGLSASLARSVWYRLVDAAKESGSDLVIHSGDWRYRLGPSAS